MSAAEQGAESGPFQRRLMLILAGLGVVGFMMTLLLGAYAPDLRSGKDGGPHALSNASVGFSGLIRLAEATGRSPRILRDIRHLDGEELAVVTPPDGAVPLGDILARRGPRATLILLPKWETERRDTPKGWVSVTGLMPPNQVDNVLSPDTDIKIARRRTQRALLQSRSPLVPSGDSFHEPRVLQTMSGAKLEPLIVDSKGAIVLAKVGKDNLYLLSDPDLLNNHGLADRKQAEAALALLDDLNSTDADGILFDVTANGFGGSRNPLQLLLGPPFLGVTLIILAALFLAGWQALVRFGAPSMAARAIALGKSALIDNSAAIVRKARREVRLGHRYTDLIRERAAKLFHLPANLEAWEIDRALDRLRPDRPFSELKLAIDVARTPAELAVAARAMHDWYQETKK